MDEDASRDRLMQIHYQLLDVLNTNMQAINRGKLSAGQATQQRLKLNWIATEIDKIKG